VQNRLEKVRHMRLLTDGHLFMCLAPEEPAAKIDKEAASRFIKHAIAQASKQPVQDEPTLPPVPSAPVPVIITSKMKARAEYEQQLKEEDAHSTEEEELKVIDEVDNDNSMDIDKPSKVTPEALLDTIADVDQTQVGKKRRRRPVDPFAGMYQHFVVCVVGHLTFVGYGDGLSTSDEGIKSQSNSVPGLQVDNSKIDSGSQNSTSSAPSSKQRTHPKPEKKKKKRSKQKEPVV
jgi:exosome complex protein LRP1